MSIKPITFQTESISFVAPSWSQMQELALELAQNILNTGQSFDRIITLAKGGWPMTRSLVDYLQIAQVASIGIKFYSGINQRLKQPQIYQEIPISVENERVLLFDDVADTGESLIFAKQYLIDRGVKQISTATLFYKPHSKIIPDFHAATTDSWIIFPYDAVETIKVFSAKWAKQKLKRSIIIDRFKSLNIPQNVIKFYYEQK